MKLTIYGTPSSKYEFLKHSIRKTAERAGIHLEVEEVMNVQEFIKNDIKSVPAIKMEKSVIIDAGGSPDFESFVNKVLNRILEEEKHDERKVIVVPTDFSSTSRQSLDYILSLMKRVPSIFKLLYVYHPIPDLTGINMVSELPDIQRASLKSMEDAYQEKINNNGSTNLVESIFINGLASEKIIDVLQDEHADLAVMGTSGKGDTFKNLFGSVSLEIARRSETPLLLIPPTNKQTEVHKILFLTNDPSIEQYAFSTLVNFAKTFEAEILILHIADEKEAPYQFDWFRRSYNKIDTKEIRKDDDRLEEIICDYAESTDINMIAMVHGKRSFISNLFHRSISKRMAIHTDFPLMILPPKKL